ncbi:hypothetical protein LY625_03870 [Lysobacter sp. GX 14042]|uniref:hypothetical protein n=1 Tax=Lysobacter sp. GX 14042 TaxID=2907155 RepID=UPI001F2CB2B9|nr:hypothetical protein [Lysobacter sp. GX 14042]MCE7031762.1 hypothetical protein [Lysobacter sp. GX 14042]
MLERKATQRELQNTNRAIGDTAIALSTLVGQMFAAMARQSGASLSKLEADFRQIASEDERGELHSTMLEVLARALQLEAKRSELQSTQSALQQHRADAGE